MTLLFCVPKSDLNPLVDNLLIIHNEWVVIYAILDVVRSVVAYLIVTIMKFPWTDFIKPETFQTEKFAFF
jgi:hypothetical protein